MNLAYTFDIFTVRFLHRALQAENDFILPLEKEVFIEQLKDIVDKAEDMLSEDTEGERNSNQGSSPKKSEGADVHGTEVSERLSEAAKGGGGAYRRASGNAMTWRAMLPKISFSVDGTFGSE